ncbi:hypothetical protein, partial [Effusibacillus consociatus]
KIGRLILHIMDYRVLLHLFLQFKYKKENQNKLDKLSIEVGSQEEVFVTITFAKPIDDTKLNKFIQDYKLNVKHAIVRSTEKGTNLRGTLLMKPEASGTFEKQSMDEIHQLLTGNQATFKGFIELVATVPNSQLKALTADQLVFLADPSADDHFVSNAKNEYMPGVFWNLEDTNMVSE